MDKITIVFLITLGLLAIAVFIIIYLYRKAERNRIVTTIYEQIIDVAAVRSSSLQRIGWGISYIRKHGNNEYYDKMLEITRILTCLPRNLNQLPCAYFVHEMISECEEKKVQDEFEVRFSGAVRAYIYEDDTQVEARMEKVAEQYVFAEMDKFNYYISVVDTCFSNFSDKEYRKAQTNLFMSKVLLQRNAKSKQLV